MYGSQHSYYPYSEYNNNTDQNPQQQQNDQMNGYFGYDGHGTYQQSSQSQLHVDQSADGSHNPLQHLNYQNDWIPSENYDAFNNWSFVGQNQQQSYNDVGAGQGFTNQTNIIHNQSNESSYFASFDEVPIDLIEQVYKDVNLPSQSWNQNPNITYTGHRPSNNQFNNLVPPVDDHHVQHGSKSYPHQTISYHLGEQTPSAPYQELNNNNLVSSNNSYLVSTGYVLSQLESSTLPDVTTTQSQLLQNVSPITESSSDHSLAIDNSSLVLEVNCFKCKLCDFISLVKSNVLNHLDTSHKSGGQMLTNSGTDQIVIGSSVPPSTIGRNELQESSQGPQFLVSNLNPVSDCCNFHFRHRVT